MPSDDADEGPFLIFRPRRWRVFVWSATVYPASLACIVAILHAVHWWSDGWDSWVFVAGYTVVMCGYLTWRAPRQYALSVDDTEISDSLGRAIPLGALDRVRSARRSLGDRINGRQRLYSTSGMRMSVWRAAFDSSDFRELLDLLQVNREEAS